MHRHDRVTQAKDTEEANVRTIPALLDGHTDKQAFVVGREQRTGGRLQAVIEYQRMQIQGSKQVFKAINRGLFNVDS
jgi:hypothetical protein